MIGNVKLIYLSALSYFVALLFSGYAFGSGDQIEIISVFNYWNDSTLYANDFYIQSFIGKSFTERSPFLYLVYWLTGGNELGIFLLHLMSSLFLFAGLIRVGERISGSAAISTFAVLIVLTVGNLFSLGDNEIYYNLLIPSILAKSLAVWAIYYWLEKNDFLAILLLMVSTYMQPLVGLQLFVIFCFAAFVLKRDPGRVVLQSLLYLGTVSPWLFVLLSQQSDGTLPFNDYLEILEFRIAHHFLPQYFDPIDYIWTIGLFIVALFWLRTKSRDAMMILITIVLGCLAYSIFVLGYDSKLFLNTQWFKSTIWLEFIAIIALLDFVRSKLNWDTDSPLFKSISLGLIPLAALLFVSLGVKNVSFNMPWATIDSDEIEISKWVSNNTGTEAVFLTPPSFTAFKVNSRRSSWIDYKAMIHHHDVMSRWYDRVKQVYDIDITDRRSGELKDKLNTWPSNLDSEQINFIHLKGITHLILPTSADYMENASLREIYRSTSDEYVVLQF